MLPFVQLNIKLYLEYLFFYFQEWHDILAVYTLNTYLFLEASIDTY